MALDHEAGEPGDLPRKPLQILGARELCRPAATPADDVMAMGEPGGGIAMAAVFSMDTAHETEALQQCQGPVDGHDTHPGMPAEGSRVDLLRKQGALCPG
jgi:hypothetical protein